MTDRQTHYFPETGDRVVTEQLSAKDFLAFKFDTHGNTLFGYGTTRLEAIADLALRTRLLESFDG